jgi:hypothetical protein
MAKREYMWFIEPLDSATNEALSRELSEEKFCREIICGDGKKRNLWGCRWEFVYSFKMSKSASGFRFKVFNRRGGGKIREFKFPYLKKFRKRKK